MNKKKIKLEKFEKDDDLNGHIDFIDFIYPCSNRRERNYNIKGIEKQKVKITAGRIIPAISTTTASNYDIYCMSTTIYFKSNK